MSENVHRIAMWCGPRNISTALMRSWGNRPDTAVWDEPLYAHYLLQTGIEHPGAQEVIEHHETDWRKVVERITGPVPEGKPIFYQKHMTHHMLPNVGRDWMAEVTHAFLIRHPREVLISLSRVVPRPTLEETGLPQQWELFSQMKEQTGEAPPVIDARAVLENSEGQLRLLCDALGVPFLDCMLSWPAGLRATDGVWAKYWYDAVMQSTGFERYRPPTQALPGHLAEVLAAAERIYARLYAYRLGA
jgi:hypothetical protein